MTLVLKDTDLDGLPVMQIAIDALEDAFRARFRGELTAPPRHHVPFGTFGDLVFTIGGTTGAAPVAGFRVYDTFGAADRTQIIAVWSMENAALEGIVLGKRLGEARTGAIGGIAIRHMSAPDADRLGLIGTGSQARTQLEAAAAVRKLRQVRVYSRDRLKRNGFAAEMTQSLGLDIEPAETALAAVDGADIVICATNSTTPVIAAEWLKPGAHVNSIGFKTIDEHEIGVDVAEKAALIATDSPEQIKAYKTPFFLNNSPCAARMADLADITNAPMPTRSTGGKISLFCSVGLAGTEVLVASKVLAAYRGK